MKQANQKSFRVSLTYKYGYEVPKNYKDAQRLDEKKGITKWMDSNKLEHKQLTEHEVFKDQGPFTGCMIPRGYQLIQVHKIFDVKVDVRHKSQVVTDGNLIVTPAESVYSGVVSLKSLGTYLFIGELD